MEKTLHRQRQKDKIERPKGKYGVISSINGKDKKSPFLSDN